MYKVYIDDKLLYDSSLELLQLHNPSLELELNKAGSFSFIIYPDHPYFNRVKKLSPIITVKQKGFIIFRGRVLDLEQRFYNEKNVLCEGELAFLTDSVQRPYDFQSGDKHTTIPELFAFFINNHNSQVDENHRFKVGKVTVSDGNNYIVRKNDDYSKTLEAIKSKLLDVYGGYLWIRHEADGNYIDYLKDFNVLSSQPIKFGKNLLDLKRFSRGADIATAIIPLGAKNTETGERVTIESVNNGIDFICDETEADRYKSKIFKVMYWDDVTTPNALLKKAESALEEAVNVPGSVELTAVDLAAHDTEFSAFHLGTYVKTESEPHELDLTMLVTKLSIKLDSPGSNKLTLGAIFPTGSDQIIDKGSNNDWYNDIKTSVDNDIGEAISIVKKELYSSIEQSEEAIRGEVSETVKTINSRIETTEKTVSFLEQKSDELALSVSNFEIELDELSGDYTILSRSVSQLSIDLEGIEAVVSAHGEDIGDLSSLISQTAESITSEVTRAQNAESSLSSKITQTASSIRSEVSSSISGVNGRIDETETSISYIEQTINSIDLAVENKVGYDDIINAIRISTEGVKIQASKLDLSIGGKNNDDGAMNVYDYYGDLIAKLDMDGLELYDIDGRVDFSAYNGNYGMYYWRQTAPDSYNREAGYTFANTGTSLNLYTSTSNGDILIRSSKNSGNFGAYCVLSSTENDYPIAGLYASDGDGTIPFQGCGIQVNSRENAPFFHYREGGYSYYEEMFHSGNLLVQTGTVTIAPTSPAYSGGYKGSYYISDTKGFSNNAVMIVSAITSDPDVARATFKRASDGSGFNIYLWRVNQNSTGVAYMIIEPKFQTDVLPP